jgi:hypothetical protein
MSEIKIALDLFEKGNKLTQVVNGLKAVDGLVKTINRKKINLLSDDLDKKLKTLGDITRLVRQIDKEKKKEVANQEKLNRKLKQEAGILGGLKKRVKDLKLDQNAAKTTKELDKVNKELQEAQMNVRKFGALGKKNTNTFSNALSSFGFKFNFLSDIISGTAFAISSGLTNALRDSVNVFKDFEQSQANLAAVLGLNIDQVTQLTEDAKRLGSTTAFTASQVSELQTEYAKLGFTQQEILQVTESTLDASAALRSELGEQAALTGSIIRGFNLDASEATRVNDILAKSASRSALDFQKLSTALPIVGATAKNAGVSLERTTALLGTLSDRGVDASTAATGLRNVFLELAKRGLTYEEALGKIQNATNKNAAALELFGKRGATIGTILAETTESVDALEESLENATGFAAKTAATQLDTLNGAIIKLQSAWEGFILSIEDGDGVLSSFIRGTVENLTEILGRLSGELGGVKEDTVDLLHANTDLINNTEELTNRYIELADKTELTADEKTELNNITNDLVGVFGDSITQINNETGALEINRKELIRQIQIRQVLQTEQVKELLGEKLRLETSLKNEELIAQRFEATKKSILENQGAFIGFSNLVNLAENDTQGFQKALLELKASQTELTPVQEQAIRNLESYAFSSLRTGINQERLKEIQDELLRSGIDLDELTKSLGNTQNKFTSGVVKNTNDTKDNTKAKEENFNVTKAQLSLLGQFIESQELLLAEQRRDGIISEGQYNTALLQLKKERLEEEIKVLEANGKDSTQKKTELANTEYQIAQNQTNRLLKLDQDRLAAEALLEKNRKKIQDERLNSAKAGVGLAKELAGENEKAQRAALLAEKGLAVAEITINGQRQIADIGADKELTEAQKKALQVQAGLQTSIGIATVLATGFAEGGYTGDGGKYDEAGIVHKGEFVNTKEQTSKYGMRNWTAQDFDKKVSEGHFNQFTDSGLFERQNMQFMTIEKKQVGYDFSKLENELKAVKNAILSKPVTSLNVDKLGNLIEETYKNGVKENKVYKRKSRI